MQHWSYCRLTLSHRYGPFCCWNLGVVSLIFCEFSKIILRKYTMPDIIFMVKFQAETLYVCPKPCFGYTYSFSLKFSWEVRFLPHTNFERMFCRARKTIVKHPPEYFWQIRLIPWRCQEPLAAMVLAIQDKKILVFHEEGFKLSVPSQGWEMARNVNIILWFLK